MLDSKYKYGVSNYILQVRARMETAIRLLGAQAEWQTEEPYSLAIDASATLATLKRDLVEAISLLTDYINQEDDINMAAQAAEDDECADCPPF